MVAELPRVSIIILNWNNYSDTAECLDSLSKVDYPKVKVIVVDNGSTDDSLLRLRQEYSEYVFLSAKEKKRFSIGNNIGIQHLNWKFDYLLLLNNPRFFLLPYSNQSFLMR